jgi:multiple sugar transport system ATP-binding protein
MASVELQGVHKTFDAVTAIDRLSLSIADGEFFVLLGPSGAGKTTTLRLIAGLEQPDAGRVRMDGTDVTAQHPAERDCAFVFQQYSLYPHLSVFDNLAFPLRAPRRRHEPGHAPAEIAKRVQEVAALLHIEGKLQRKATALSGGEMQRVAIGRALVRRPRLYLMDEPLSSLDARLREELRVELKRLQRRTGTTVLYVTHDQVEATTLADRIGILEGGRLQQVGTPEQVYDDPASLHVAQRLGSPAINVLPAAWFDGVRLPAGTAQVAIRPEDVRCVDAPQGLACTVVECSLLNHQLVAEREGVELRAERLFDRPLAPGSALHLQFPPDRCLYFDAGAQRLAA